LLEATAAPPKAIIELITEHKPEIINLFRSNPAGPAEARVSWLDMEIAVENEAGPPSDELTRRAADDKLTVVERDTLQRAIASRARQAVIFEAILRPIESARAEFGGDTLG
jgi:hypothetical protein